VPQSRQPPVLKMTSFDEKVEALRKLQERRQARQAREKEAAKGGEDTPSTQAAGQRAVVKDLENRELPAVLEHYAAGGGYPRAAQKAPVDGEGGDSSATAETDEATAAKLKSAEADEADALYCMGHMNEQGLHECPQDMGKAVMYYRLSAEKGSAVGQWRLGHLHEYGLGMDASDAGAAHWYRLAAKAGHAHAQASLALLLEDGRASPLDDGEAFRWHQAAAGQGNALSQYVVSCNLAEGRGIAKDEVAAMSMLEKSAASGFPLAKEALAAGGLAKNAEASDDDVGAEASDEMKSGLLDMAARVAKQIGHLPDEEAESFLNELLGSLDDLDQPLPAELQEMLSLGHMDSSLQDEACPPVPGLDAWAARCTAAA